MGWIKRYCQWLLFSGLLAISMPHLALATEIISRKSIESSSTKYLTLSDGRIEYYRFGDGSPAVILISGYAVTVTNWNVPFLINLAKQHEVIIFNNRNVAGSLIDSQSYTSRDLADDVYQIITTLDLNRPFIIGMSMGGMIAMQLAVMHPHAISGIALINTAIAGKESVKPPLEVEQIVLSAPQNKVRRYFLIIKLLSPPAWWLKSIVSYQKDHFTPKLSYPLIGNDAILQKQLGLLNDWALDETTAKKITQIHVPVLVINGGADAVVPPINSDILARCIPNTTLIRWMDAGHAITYQYPEQVAAAINDFIADITPKANTQGLVLSTPQ